MKSIYSEAEIVSALQDLVGRGVDIDAIPKECTVEDVIRLSEDFARPN